MIMALKMETWKIDRLIPYARNPRKNDEQVDRMAGAIKEFGFRIPIVARSDGSVVDGHLRLKAARKLGLTEVPVVLADELSAAQVKAFRILANQSANWAEWDDELLKVELEEILEMGLDLSLTGLDAPRLDDLLGSEAEKPDREKMSLSDQFGAPPFSVLSARDGWWCNRKEQWLSLGIKSEQGRDGDQFGYESALQIKDHVKKFSAGACVSVSVFDPVLCELAYRWFCPPGGLVIDPFAGGSVRGIVASQLGRQYVGVDLREEQVQSNREQAQVICGDPMPVWHTGDSRRLGEILKGARADFVFSCPPYADLERYSDDPADLSTMTYYEFLKAYRGIVSQCVEIAADDSFLCFVVGEVRDKKGIYYEFVADTVKAFSDAGAAFYNDAVLVTQVCSLAVRCKKAFETSRKLGKTHQNVLIFVKGDPKKAAEKVGKVSFGEE